MHAARMQGRPTTRRALLAAGLCAVAMPGRAEGLRRVLFIGNSFLAEHTVPARVAALSAAAGREIRPHAILRNGARLALHASDPLVTETLEWGWEAVVLQDHSTEALHPDRSRQSAEAVRQIARRARGAVLVLAVPWARAEGHPLYARPGMPDGPAAMARANADLAVRIAVETGAEVADIAGAFLEAERRGLRVHGPDGYHASAAGADLAARVIWAALSRAFARA